MLRSSADQVRDAMVAGTADVDAGVGTDAVADDAALGLTGSLLHCAQLLVDDGNLMPDMLADASQDAFDRSVRAQGEKILASGRQNVTSLQARAGMMNDRGARAYWRGSCVRFQMSRRQPRSWARSSMRGRNGSLWPTWILLASSAVLKATEIRA